MEISIIVPFHRGKNYLQDCLESICDQNMDCFETILVLDHVEEQIDDLLERFEDTASLRVFSLEGKRGVAAARNLGLEEAEGNYVCFLDSDDYLLENSLYEFLHGAVRQKADLTLGFVEKTWYKRKSFLKQQEEAKEAEQKETKEEGKELSIQEESVLGMLFKKELLDRYQIRFEEQLQVYSDLPFLTKYLRVTKSWVREPKALYIKRYHNDPIQFPSLSQKEIPDRPMQFVKSVMLAFQEAEGDADLKKELEQLFLRYVIRLYQKKIFPKQGQTLPGTQFQKVCETVRQCDKNRMKDFERKERKILEGFWQGKESKCIWYGTLSMAICKFKKSRTKQTAVYRMLERFIFKKMSIKENWVLFESFLGKNYADSCKYIYRYMDENLGDQYQYIWVRRNPEDQVEGSAITVKYMGLQHFYYAARAKYWVNNMRQPIWREKRPGQIFLETWHGTPLKKLVFDMEDVHSATATYKADFYKQSRQWDYLLSDNPFSTKVFESAFLYPREKILEHGYPRNDILHSEQKEEIGRKIREKLGIPKEKKTILYAPTWRDDAYYAPGQYKFQLALELDKMQEALGQDYVLLLRTHYFIADQLDTTGYEGFLFNVSHYDDVSELYLISDLCITDYSSVFFDYANLSRPLLFYTYDLEKYRDILRGFYIDMEKEVPGPLLYTTEEVIEAVLHIDEITEVFAERYDKFYRKFCCWDDGHASERIVKDVFGVSNEEKNTSMD